MQSENEKVYSLGRYVAVWSETNDWFMCVISEINDPSKEVKVRFMRKSGQYFLLSKSRKNGSQTQQYFTDAPYHPLTTENKNIYQIETSRWTFIFAYHSSNECNKKEVVDIGKKFNCLLLRFSQAIDISDRGQLL